VPLAGAERVVVRRAETLRFRRLAALGERRVGLLVLGGRKGEPAAHLVGLPHADATVRLGQFALANDEARTLALARIAVKGKLAGQLAVLREALQSRPDRRKPLFDAEAEVARILEQISAAGSLDILRGLEGAAAAGFLRGYCTLFPPALAFVGRNRRPPRDPVNAALSLAYTLLHAEAVRAAWVAGLDPFVGFLHAPLAGRESLACDLVELCRPMADRWVWRLFAERLLREDHFSTVDGACLMGKAGRATFYEAYEALAVVERRRLRHAAAALARAARAAYGSAL
jgi:CRISPR-associated protein Cas1